MGRGNEGKISLDKNPISEKGQLGVKQMNEQITFDDELAKKLRDDGMKRAIDHAEKDYPGWKDMAFGYLKEYLTRSNAVEFTGERVRIFAESEGFIKPPDKRAWGSVMTRGAKAGLIVKIGWTTASDPKVHKNPVSLWRRA